MRRNTDYDVLILGSGPSGTGAALGLAKKGLRVAVVDVGNTPQPHNLDSNFYCIKRDPVQWREALLGPHFEYLCGIFGYYVMPKKRPPLFRFALQDDQHPLTRLHSSSFQGDFSYAFGGLANIWGGQLLRWDDADLASFPFGVSELAPYYERLESAIGISGENDDLSSFYGTSTALQAPLPLMAGGANLLARYLKVKRHLNAYGVHIGRPRAGVLTAPHAGRPAHDFQALEFFRPDIPSIYCPAQSLKSLIQNGDIEYLPGYFAELFSEEENCVHLHIRKLPDGGMHSLTTRALLLAAGTLGSARLALASLASPGTRLPIAENLLSYVPLVNPLLLGKVQETKSIYMQLNLCYRPEDRKLVMGTFYGISGLLLSDFIAETPLSLPCAARMLPKLTPAMLVLHLWHGAELCPERNWVELEEDGSLQVTYTDRLDGRIERSIIRQVLKLGWLSLPSLVQYPLPGNSFHYAGTLAMREHPRPFECSTQGLLHGTRGVYVVDGAALPSVSAKNLSLTIMANSMRIADGLAQRLLAENS